MRPDMFKVIVERPRFASHEGYFRREAWRRATRRLAPEDWPRREVASRKTKCLSENLAPLRRFLQRRVNRAWNDVFSEICERLNVRSAVQKHVRDHLEDFVAVHVERVHGELREKTWHGWRWQPGTPPALRKEFYVDPNSGHLRANPGYRRRWWKREESRAKDRLVLDSTRELRKLADIWYEIGFVAAPTDDGELPVWDVLQRRSLTRAEMLAVYRGLKYAARKRQLNWRELRDYRRKYADVFA